MVGTGGGNTFSPATVTIAAGQGVTWVWVSGFHSVASDSPPKVWADSAGQASGQFVVNALHDAGDVPELLRGPRQDYERRGGGAVAKAQSKGVQRL